MARGAPVAGTIVRSSDASTFAGGEGGQAEPSTAGHAIIRCTRSSNGLTATLKFVAAAGVAGARTRNAAPRGGVARNESCKEKARSCASQASSHLRLAGLAATYFPTSWDAVSSARRSLTAEFGMGSGSGSSLLPPSQPNAESGLLSSPVARRRASRMRVIKPIERLVPVSFTHCCASTPGLSTWWSSTALKGEIVLRGASRLDAFSGYPVRT
jgi:hypothetical protein